VYLCWEIEGNLFQYDNWYVDNIKFLTTNTEIGQVQATGATALVVIPEITVDGVPINPEVSFAGLTGNPLIMYRHLMEQPAIPSPTKDWS
jgi:hypothetical protein